MHLRCEICGKPAVPTPLGGRLCDQHQERQCPRCGSRLVGGREAMSAGPCSSCRLRDRVQELSDADRRAVRGYIEAGQMINAVIELRRALGVSISDAAYIAHGLGVPDS